jgi:HSP20 family molecular chaperone IbpA
MRTETANRSERSSRRIQPPVDVRETPEGIRLVAELPGAAPESISVEIDGEALTIEATKRDAAPGRRTIHREILRGRYERTFALSRDLSRDGITAAYREGLLEVFVPKAEHTIPKRIELQTES